MIAKKLSYANVVATLALFIALGGGAIAALHIPANSVGTHQLKDGAVTGVKVRPGSLSGEDLAAHSISASELPLIGLANLQGASGTATNQTQIELKKGECGRYVFNAAGAEPGDAVIVQGSDISALAHAIEAGPSISNPNLINVSVCADAETAVNQAPGAVQLRYDTLR